MTCIQGEQITYTYKKSPAIKGLSLKIDAHEMVAVVGNNGSGKTTLGKLLAGIIKPQLGRVCHYGKDIRNMSLGDIGRYLGYLYQQPRKQIFAPTVREQLLLVHILQGKPLDSGVERMREILHMFQLLDKEEASTYHLSYGEIQRLALGSVLYNRPEFLILDEPMTGLDQERIDQLWDMLHGIHKQGVGMLMMTHRTDCLQEHVQRVITLDKGEIMDDRRYAYGSKS